MGAGEAGANGKDNAARAEGDDSRPPQLAIMPDEIMSVQEAAERFVSDITLLLDEQDPALVAKVNGKTGPPRSTVGATATSTEVKMAMAGV